MEMAEVEADSLTHLKPTIPLPELSKMSVNFTSDPQRTSILA